MQYCSNCGSELGDGDKFCQNCGKPIQKINSVAYQPQQCNRNTDSYTKEIKGDFPVITSKIPLILFTGEFLIYQNAGAFVKSSIAMGMFSLTNKRIIFSKDTGAKSFLKRGGLLGMALNSGANIPNEISLSDMIHIEPVSCIQGSAGMLITVSGGYQYKLVLQSMSPLKTKELCQARDRIVTLIKDAI